MSGEERWDMIRAELFDTIRSTHYSRPVRPCAYCGTTTRALSGVCTAHSDLPKHDPYRTAALGDTRTAHLARVSPSAAVAEPHAVPVHGVAPAKANGRRGDTGPSKAAALAT